jgi:threonine/homoserine/homoserine lactone efflux protein
MSSERARVARARVMTRVSGATLIALGAWLALARRQA